MEPEIKIVGEMDYIFREDRSVFDINGLAPTLKTSNYERKILIRKRGKDESSEFESCKFCSQERYGNERQKENTK